MRWCEFVIIGTLVLARGIHCRNCSEIVTRLSGGLLHYLAELSVPAPKSHNGTWSLELYTDVPYTFLGGWGVVIEPDAEHGKALIRDAHEDRNITQGENISFHFRVGWFTGEPQPQVIGIIWEGIDICSPSGSTISAVQASKRKEYERMRGDRLPVNG